MVLVLCLAIGTSALAVENESNNSDEQIVLSNGNVSTYATGDGGLVHIATMFYAKAGTYTFSFYTPGTQSGSVLAQIYD